MVFDVPHSARIWNCWLGGKDHYPTDRAAADAWASQHPNMVRSVRQSRAFVTRAVGHLAGSAGVRQFLDLGTGLPFTPNLHEVVQEVVSGSRMVYVDHNPLVLAHARALLTSATATGSSEVLAADLRQPAQLITHARLEAGAPVAVILSHVLGELTDPGEAHQTLTRLIAAVAPGSYLLLCEPTHPTSPRRAITTHTATATATANGNAAGGFCYRLSSPHELAEMVKGLELIPPGLVTVDRWRPGHLDLTDPTPCDAYGVLARTPRRIRATSHPRVIPNARAGAV